MTPYLSLFDYVGRDITSLDEDCSFSPFSPFWVSYSYSAYAFLDPLLRKPIPFVHNYGSCTFTEPAKVLVVPRPHRSTVLVFTLPCRSVTSLIPRSKTSGSVRSHSLHVIRLSPTCCNLLKFVLLME